MDAYMRLARQVRPITEEQARDDCAALRAGKSVLSGCMLTDRFFFPHRLAVQRWRGVAVGRPTFREYVRKGMHYPSEHKFYAHKREKDGLGHMKALLRTYEMFYGSVNQFRPMLARQLLLQYRPRCVLDFCAGWGGRLAAAMSLDVEYIGFDSNPELRPAYDAMVQLVQPGARVRMRYCDSAGVDFSKYTYDMVLTSPPYMTYSHNRNRLTELYRNMPVYKNRAEFNQRFLHRVVRNAFEHLQPGGIFALNVSTDMYQELLPVLGKSTHSVPLSLAPRRHVRGGELHYSEYIYVWRKKKPGCK